MIKFQFIYRSSLHTSPSISEIENQSKICSRWGDRWKLKEEEKVREERRKYPRTMRKKKKKKKKNKYIIPVRYIFFHAGGNDFILRAGRTRFFCPPQIANCCTFYGRRWRCSHTWRRSKSSSLKNSPATCEFILFRVTRWRSTRVSRVLRSITRHDRIENKHFFFCTFWKASHVS